MLMNLTDVFTSEGKERKEVFALESDTALHMGAEYKILEKSPVEVTFTNIASGKVMMRGGMQLVLEIPCDRCLTIVKEPLSIEFERELQKKKRICLRTQLNFVIMKKTFMQSADCRLRWFRL